MSPRPVIVEVVKRRTLTLVKPSPTQPSPTPAAPTPAPTAKKPPKPEAVARGKSIAGECPDLATLFAKNGAMRLHRVEEALRSAEVTPLLRELRFFVGGLTLRALAAAGAPEAALPDDAPVVAPELPPEHRVRVRNPNKAQCAAIAAAILDIPPEPKATLGLRLLARAGEVAPAWPIGVLTSVLSRAGHADAALSLRGAVLSCRAGRFSAMVASVMEQLKEEGKA